MGLGHPRYSGAYSYNHKVMQVEPSSILPDNISRFVGRGGRKKHGQTCHMTTNKSFIRYLANIRRHFSKMAVIIYNATHHNTKRVLALP